MSTMEREAVFQPGPRFFKGADGKHMFEHRIDSRNVVGPREATEKDKTVNSKLWLRYLAGETEKLDAELHGAAVPPARQAKKATRKKG